MAASCKRRRVLREPAPVGIGLLDDDLALFDQALEDLVDVEAVAALVQADADVLEIKKDGERGLAVRMPVLFHSTLVMRTCTACHFNPSRSFFASLPAIVVGYFLTISVNLAM